MKRYEGGVPLNARISVDYDHNKVRFSYPRRMNKRNAMLLAIFELYMIFILIEGFALIGVLIIYVLITTVSSVSTFSMFGWDLSSVLLTISHLIVFSGIPGIITLYIARKPENLLYWFPKINAKFSEILNRGYYEVIFRKTDNKKVEIPLFSNVILKYNAFGDFSKYLSKVKIREHPFNKRIRGKKHRTQNLWKATFTFKRECKTGYLKIMFI